MENDAAQALTLRRITTSEAAQAFAACVGLDPEGRATPHTAAAAGECFAVEGAAGAVAVSVQFNQAKRIAWIVGAAGGGGGMAGPVLAFLERIAAHRGCKRIGFQTMRAGLRRVAQRQGYQVTENKGRGVMLTKNL